MSVSIDAVARPSSRPSNAPSEPAALTGADFAATLRDYTERDDEYVMRFARINAFLRVERVVYPDAPGCRSWLVW